MSMIFDAFVVEWNNGGPDPEVMPSVELVLTVTGAARGQRVNAWVRGFASPPSGAVRLEAGGRSVELRPEEENYRLEAGFTLDEGGDETRVRLTLDLPKPEDGCSAAMLTVDSIDLHIPACDS